MEPLLKLLTSMLTQILETLDAVIDVGGVFDSEKDRFDHHQRGFDHTFGRGFVTKLSSAGLIYKVILQFRVFYLKNGILSQNLQVSDL